MCGIVWFVQIIHYPLFDFVSANEFKAYEQEHVGRTKYLIMPLMLSEIATAIALVWNVGFGFQNLIWLNFILLIFIWLSTFLVQVPFHTSLSSGKDSQKIKKLVRSNWIRTVLWTVRLIILIAII
jgi:hypothetical protein